VPEIGHRELYGIRTSGVGVERRISENFDETCRLTNYQPRQLLGARFFVPKMTEGNKEKIAGPD